MDFNESVSNARLGARHLLREAGSALVSEKVLLLVDETSHSMVTDFQQAALDLGVNLEVTSVPVGENHGEEPPAEVANHMRSFPLVIALTAFSFAHSRARLEASRAGARFLSLPQYSRQMLGHEMTRVDYRAIAPTVKRVAEVFSEGKEISITSNAGTDIRIDVEGRRGNYCPAFVERAGDLGSPPDIEANVSPLENGANGIVVVDGSITHPTIGLLFAPVVITFQSGLATEFKTSDSLLQKKIDYLFKNESAKRRILAEVGVGLNPLAKLTGVMLSDEGALGTAHLGLGSNFFVGGENLIDFHLDFVVRNPTVVVDQTSILERGVLQL